MRNKKEVVKEWMEGRIVSRKDRNNSSKEAMDFAVCGIIPLGRVEMKTVLGNFDLTIPLENGEIAR